MEREWGRQRRMEIHGNSPDAREKRIWTPRTEWKWNIHRGGRMFHLTGDCAVCGHGRQRLHPNFNERSQFSPNDSDKAVIMDNFRETRYVGSSKNLAIGNEPKMIIRERFIPHYEESAIFGYFISMRIEILELAGRRYSANKYRDI